MFDVATESSAKLLHVTVDADNVREILLFFHQEIARQRQEIGYLNRQVEELSKQPEVKRLAKRFDEFVESVHQKTEGIAAEVHSLGQSFVGHQERVKSQLQEQTNQMSACIVGALARMDAAILPLANLPNAVETLSQAIETKAVEKQNSKRTNDDLSSRTDRKLAKIQGRLQNFEATLSSTTQSLTKQIKAADAKIASLVARSTPPPPPSSPPSLRLFSHSRIDSPPRSPSSRPRVSRSGSVVAASSPPSPNFTSPSSRGSHSPANQSDPNADRPPTAKSSNANAAGGHPPTAKRSDSADRDPPPTRARFVATVSPRRGPSECDVLSGRVTHIHDALRAEINAVRETAAAAAMRAADCVTRADVVAMLQEIAAARRGDEAAVAAHPIHCLACGRTRVGMTACPGFVDPHLIALLNAQPQTDAGERPRSARVTTLRPESARREARPQTVESTRRPNRTARASSRANKDGCAGQA
jgi:hypothetical protein